MSTMDDDGRVSTTILMTTLTAAEPAATEATLRTFVDQGLLPPREHTGQDGRRPVWTYPPGSDDQLRALLRLRRSTRKHDALRVVLWVRGYPIDPERVLDAMRATVSSLVTRAQRTVDRMPGDTARERERAFAVDAAGRRGDNAVAPRRPDVSKDDRINAVDDLTSTLVFGNEVESTEATQAAAERILLLDHAQKPALASELAAPFEGLPELNLGSMTDLSLPYLLSILQSVNSDDLAEVRPIVQTMLDAVVAIVPTLSSASRRTIPGAETLGTAATDAELAAYFSALTFHNQQAYRALAAQASGAGSLDASAPDRRGDGDAS